MHLLLLSGPIAAMQAKAKKKAGLFGAIGQIGGAVLGNMFGAGGFFGGPAVAGATAGAGTSFLAALPFFSDAELKTNVRRIGTHKSGLPLYKWDWNTIAHEIGATEHDNVGVMAHEAKEKFPQAVYTHPNGYMMVNYARLQ